LVNQQRLIVGNPLGVFENEVVELLEDEFFIFCLNQKSLVDMAIPKWADLGRLDIQTVFFIENG
jgi:hypothetical protein